MTLPVVAVALLVLLVAGVLLLREVQSSLRDKKKNDARSSPPPAERASTAPPVLLSEPPTADAGEAEDLTTVASMPRKPLRSLVSSEEINDEEENSSQSEAITLFEDRAEVDEPTSPSELFVVAAVAQSDRGQKRRRNEDSFLISDEHALFLVADGMGGAAGGDIASNLAVSTVGEAFKAERFPVKAVDPNRPVYAMQFVSAIEAAHKAVVDRAKHEPDLRGMGTTLVGARFLSKKRRVYVAHVGDSRCYRLRDGSLKLLTTDHTLAARGMPGPMGNSIRRAIGVGKRVKVDLVVDIPKPGDVYLLCSDGLNKMIDDDAIRASMLSSIEDNIDMDALAKRLVDEANSAGGKDNITALVAQVLDKPQEAQAS